MTVQARIEKRARFASMSGRGVLVTHTGAYTKTFLRNSRKPEVREKASLPVDERPSKTFLCKLP